MHRNRQEVETITASAVRQLTGRYKGVARDHQKAKECEFYESGFCELYGEKCTGYDEDDCVDDYDPYLSGDIEEW